MAEERREDKAPRPEGQGSGEGKPKGNRHKRFRGPRRDGAPREGGTPGQMQLPGGKAVTAPKGSEAQVQEPKKDSPLCPICQKPIYDMSNAVAEPSEGLPAHFDCILDRVSAAETLAPNEKIVYLGGGAFGVVEFKDKNEASFVVKRRIQWEKEGEKKDWRKSMSSGIVNL